jgi:N-acetylneuraminic acid mutarotase
MYVTGGIDNNFRYISRVERYSLLSDTWSVSGPLPEACAQHTTVAVGSTIYVLGGTVGEDCILTPGVIMFDSVQGIWTRVAPMPSARRDAAVCVIGSDVLVFGGEDDEEEDVFQFLVFKYDTDADKWSNRRPCLTSPTDTA